MLFIFGKRMARVAKFIDREHICYPCKSHDREILVYRPYFNLCFIPVFPIGGNEFSMQCQNCSDDTNLDIVLNEYRNKVRTPFYLFSAWILAALIALIWFYWNSVMTKHKMEFIEKPTVGDVYTIKKGEGFDAAYYFLKIVKLDKDSVKLLHNNLDYGDYVSRLSRDDYFVSDDTVVLKSTEPGKMLERGEIYSVDRDYNDVTNFNRVK